MCPWYAYLLALSRMRRTCMILCLEPSVVIEMPVWLDNKDAGYYECKIPSYFFLCYRSSGKEKIFLTWCAELLDWERHGSLVSGITSRTQLHGLKWTKRWLLHLNCLKKTMCYVNAVNIDIGVMTIKKKKKSCLFVVAGSRSGGAKRRTHHLSLPGQVLPWKCRGGASARYHTTSLLSTSNYTLFMCIILYIYTFVLSLSM